MDEHPTGAILQRDKTTYAIVPRTPGGIVTPEHLEKIAAIARKYEIPIIKITSGQRFALVGIKRDDIDPIWRELGMDVGRVTELCLHYVQTCPGTDVCKFGTQDSLGLGREIEEFFIGMELPTKAKIGVSGCQYCCAESFVRDVGLFGKKAGWSLVIGGCSGRKPRAGELIRESIPQEEVIPLVKRALEYYRDHARKKERMAQFVDRVGIEAVKTALS